MTEYVTRVELHNETSDDYTKLHAAMELRGFARTVEVNGIRYRMPDATYLSYSDMQSQQIYDLAQAAVTQIGRMAGIVVAASAGTWAGGLYPA